MPAQNLHSSLCCHLVNLPLWALFIVMLNGGASKQQSVIFVWHTQVCFLPGSLWCFRDSLPTCLCLGWGRSAAVGSQSGSSITVQFGVTFGLIDERPISQKHLKMGNGENIFALRCFLEAWFMSRSTVKYADGFQTIFFVLTKWYTHKHISSISITTPLIVDMVP